MSKVYEFLKECEAFFVLTKNGEYPAGRPFGAIMEIENDLYIATADMKAVYKQLKDNGHIQLLALKPGTREWIRVTGMAKECDNLKIKEKMLLECPVLRKHYSTAENEHYNVFRIHVNKKEFFD